MALTASRRSKLATLTTNSPLASTLTTVSFLRPSRWLTAEKTTVGGLAATPLKNENGARFTTPAGRHAC